jgi:hypothetical protein
MSKTANGNSSSWLVSTILPMLSRLGDQLVGIDISLICGNITRGLRMLSCLLVLKLDNQTDIDADQLIAKYFDKFGDIWADAYFSRQIAMAINWSASISV